MEALHKAVSDVNEPRCVIRYGELSGGFGQRRELALQFIRKETCYVFHPPILHPSLCDDIELVMEALPEWPIPTYPQASPRLQNAKTIVLALMRASSKHEGLVETCVMNLLRVALQFLDDRDVALAARNLEFFTNRIRNDEVIVKAITSKLDID